MASLSAAFVAGILLNEPVGISLALPWLMLNLRHAAAEWMIRVGLGSLAGYWGMLWIHGPMILTGAIAGLAIARMRRRNRGTFAIAFSIGAVASEIGSYIYFAGGAYLLGSLPWKCLAFPTTVSPAWWADRRSARRVPATTA